METLLKIFISSIPILLLIGAWIYLARRSPAMEAQRQMPEYMKRHIEVNERIAVALEKLAENNPGH